MKHIKGEMSLMGQYILVEFKIFLNRVYINSNNPMVRSNFIKFMENQAAEAMKKNGEDAMPIKQSNNSTWVEITLPYPEEEASEQIIVDKMKDDLEKANMKVTIIK